MHQFEKVGNLQKGKTSIMKVSLNKEITLFISQQSAWREYVQKDIEI